MKILRMLVFPVLLAAHGLAWGGYGEGYTAYNVGDYATALREWRPLAEQGDGVAQNNIGSLYYNGQGVPKDYKEAAKWYHKAAEQGVDKAQYRLAAMYAQGQGVTQDNKEAVKWYRKAAELGFVGAQKTMGAMLYYGSFDLAQDYKEAMMWYRRAAEQGDAEAQNILGIMYGEGNGVQQDYVQAYMWCSIASANGDENGTRNRDNVAEKMTPVQIAEAQILAREPGRVTGQTVADEILQRDIINHIAFVEGFPGNKGFQGKVLNTRKLTPSPELISEKTRESLKALDRIAMKDGREHPKWVREEWLIDRNGKNIYYEIILVDSYAGGVDIVTGLAQEVPFSN